MSSAADRIDLVQTYCWLANHQGRRRFESFSRAMSIAAPAEVLRIFAGTDLKDQLLGLLGLVELVENAELQSEQTAKVGLQSTRDLHPHRQ